MNIKENAKRNIIFGILNKLVMIVCPFIERTAIRYLLGSEYLGLGNLFTSILSVLSLGELGFGTAIVCCMYKPLHQGDVKEINALLNLYKKAYRIIGCVVMVIGVVIIPFLPLLVKSGAPEGINITYIYLIYLLNTVISYFMYAYLSSLIVVNQRDDIKSKINSLIKIFLTVAEIIVLALIHNFYIFVSLLPLFTVINNLFIAIVVHKEFPQFKAAGAYRITTEMKKLIAGSFIQQVCVVTRNSLDSICISAFLGLTLNAIYGNYYSIMYAVTALMGVVSAAFLGGVGNHVVSKDVSANYEELKKIDTVYLVIAGWASCYMMALFQPVMRLWMGKDMLLSFKSVILFCIYFYVLKLGDMRSMYSASLGLWWEQRYRAICETLLNVILNISLGFVFGVNGIIIATVISLILCNYIWSTRIVFDMYFGKFRRKNYYKYQMKITLKFLVAFLVCAILISVIKIDSLYISILYRFIVCTLIPGAVAFPMLQKKL